MWGENISPSMPCSAFYEETICIYPSVFRTFFFVFMIVERFSAVIELPISWISFIFFPISVHYSLFSGSGVCSFSNFCQEVSACVQICSASPRNCVSAFGFTAGCTNILAFSMTSPLFLQMPACGSLLWDHIKIFLSVSFTVTQNIPTQLMALS